MLNLAKRLVYVIATQFENVTHFSDRNQYHMLCFSAENPMVDTVDSPYSSAANREMMLAYFVVFDQVVLVLPIITLEPMQRHFQTYRYPLMTVGHIRRCPRFMSILSYTNLKWRHMNIY